MYAYLGYCVGNVMKYIRNAAKALVIQDGKMLAIKIRDGNEEWYILPGGGEDFHRVDLVFLCDYVGEIKTPTLITDTNQSGFEWLEIATLNTAPLYPSKLRRQIMNLYEGKPYTVYLGNEEIGDPEITESSSKPPPSIVHRGGSDSIPIDRDQKLTRMTTMIIMMTRRSRRYHYELHGKRYCGTEIGNRA